MCRDCLGSCKVLTFPERFSKFSRPVKCLVVRILVSDPEVPILRNTKEQMTEKMSKPFVTRHTGPRSGKERDPELKEGHFTTLTHFLRNCDVDSERPRVTYDENL